MMQEHLVDQIVTYCDHTEAVRWARHFNIPSDRLPYHIASGLDTIGE